MNLLLSPREQHFPKFTYLGSASVPKFISSNCKDELWVLTFVGFLKLLFRSNIHFRVLNPLGIKFPNFNSAWCSSSSIIATLKVSSFIKHSKICSSSSKTHRLVIMTGTEGMKSNSIEHLFFEGTNLAAEVASKSAATFFNLGMDTILNAWKFIRKSQNSFC